MDSIEASRDEKSPPVSFARARSNDHFTSLGSIGEPLENLIPGRMVKVMVLPSSDIFQAEARPGSTPLPPSALASSNVSYRFSESQISAFCEVCAGSRNSLSIARQ